MRTVIPERVVWTALFVMACTPTPPPAPATVTVSTSEVLPSPASTVRDPTALDFHPVVLRDGAEPKSMAWFQGELWALSDLRVLDKHEPLARFDGARWHLHAQPFHYPRALASDGKTLLVVAQEGIVTRTLTTGWAQTATPPGAEVSNVTNAT